MTGLLLQVQAYLERNQQAQATVMLMSWDPRKPQRKRDRGVRKSQGLELTTARALFQGAHPSSGANVGSVYPGDDELHAKGQLTVQIHRLRVVDNDSNKIVIAEDVYALAVWVPVEMERDTLVQDAP
jgi:hypothetical protein